MATSARFAFAVALCLAISVARADDPASATRGFIDIPAGRVYVETFGGGKPVLFLHGGLLFFDNNFGRQRDVFAATNKVVGYDRVGHGHSPDNGKPFSYQQMAEDAAAVIVKLGVAPVAVIGHSDGANIGLILAHDHPELVRRLAISGANLRGPTLAPGAKPRSEWSADELAAKAHAIEKMIPPNFKADYQTVNPAGPGHWDTFLVKSYELWLTSVVIAPDALKAVKAPVLVIAGDEDFTSIEETVEIFRALPHARLFIVPGTGHGTFQDSPALVNTALREFLDAP